MYRARHPTIKKGRWASEDSERGQLIISYMNINKKKMKIKFVIFEKIITYRSSIVIVLYYKENFKKFNTIS